MKYYFSKYKFTSDFFYKNIHRATVELFPGYFAIKIIPHVTYSGNYFITSIYSKDKEKTIYQAKKKSLDQTETKDSDLDNEYFIGIYKSGKKTTIFQSNLDGIILKL